MSEKTEQLASPRDEARFGTAFVDGQEDYADGCDEYDNPYDDADRSTAWLVGWRVARGDVL